MDTKDNQTVEKDTENSGSTTNDSNEKRLANHARNLVYTNKVDTQHNYFSQEEFKLDDILITPNEKYFSESSWNKLQKLPSEDELNTCLNNLLEEQITILASDNSKVRRALAYHISTKTDAEIKKELFFEKGNEKRHFSLNDLIKKFSDEKNMFILADLSQYLVVDGQKIFFDSLIHQLHTDNMSKLNRNRIFILILVTQKAAENICKAIEFGQHFQIWDFDEISANNDKLPDIDKNKTPEPTDFFDSLNHIQKILIYAGTFFNGLSFRSFDTIINLLLSSQPNCLPIVVERYRDFKKGARLIKQITEDSQTVIWQSNKNWLFKSCHLKGKDEGGMLVVDFTYPDLKEKFGRYFKEHDHYFWQEQFNIIDNSNLIFSDDGRLAIKVIELMMDALQDDSNFYDENWFWNQARKIKDYESADSQIIEESPEADFFKIIEFLTRREDANFFYDRFGQILDYMLIHGWEEMVKKILNKIANKDHDVLLKLVQRLNEHEDFDKFDWIKFLLDFANSTEVKINTYRWLANVIAPMDIKKTWLIVKRWIEEITDSENAEFSYYAARYFIVDSLVKETFYLPSDNYGKWPPLYSLFSDIIEEPSKCHEQIIYILHEFFHKDTISQITGDNNRAVLIMTIDLLILENTWSEHAVQIVQQFLESRTDSRSYQTLLADVIEGWYHIITGFEQEYNKEKEDLIQFILKSFLNEAVANSGYSGRIIKRWEKKPGFYKELIAYLKVYSQEHTDTLSNADQKALKKYGEVLYKRKNNLETFLQQLNFHLTTATL